MKSGSGVCLRFPRQAQVDPVKILAGIARRLAELGVEIHANTAVKTVRAGRRPRVETTDEKVVRARSIVVATNAPLNDRVMYKKQTAYRTYVIGMQVGRGTVVI